MSAHQRCAAALPAPSPGLPALDRAPMAAVPAAPQLSLHIERLVLHGLCLHARDGARVQAAFEGELARLSTTHPLAVPPLAGSTLHSLRVDAIRIGFGRDPEQLGRAVAASLWREIAR